MRTALNVATENPKKAINSKCPLAIRCMNHDFIKIICYLNQDFNKIYKINKIICY